MTGRWADYPPHVRSSVRDWRVPSARCSPRAAPLFIPFLLGASLPSPREASVFTGGAPFPPAPCIDIGQRAFRVDHHCTSESLKRHDHAGSPFLV